MRSRFMLELTTPDVEKYFAAGGKTAILPVGSVEMHGPHQPVGTDMLIARGFALELAKAADGMVLPDVPYTWAGSTDGFAGTITVEAANMLTLLERIADRVYRMGFSRLVVASVHSPNDMYLNHFVRTYFEKTGRAPLLINPIALAKEPEFFPGPWAQGAEASVVLAAMQLLGLGNLYTEKEMAYETEAPPFPESFKTLAKAGRVGYFMQDPRQHACPTTHIAMQRGLDLLAAAVKAALPLLDKLDEYQALVGKQKNQGSWRGE